MSDLMNQFSSVKERLDKVSPSYCVAKWKQVTLHLQNGFNHSCHHPDVHRASVREIDKNPSALHNTDYKKNLRAMMLRGERPPECAYCWKVEDAPGGHFSDRIVKSSDYWALPHLETLAATPPHADVNPSYLEVSFGNECNFRCVYCSPEISSSLWKHFEKHGPYVNRVSLDKIRQLGKAPLGSDPAKNPYIAAFWTWFPDLVRDLRIFRITGGEPLVNANTFKVFEYIQANALPELSLAVNSNFGVPERFYEKFLSAVRSLEGGRQIRDFRVFTSIDTHGEQAEYLRVGLSYPLWKERVLRFLQETPWDITFMVTFNAMSVPRFKLLLEDLYQINRATLRTAPDGSLLKRTVLDISHLMNPEYLSVFILSEDWLARMEEILAFLKERSVTAVGPAGFCDYEIHKFERVLSLMRANAWNDIQRAHYRNFFATFTAQYAQRDGVKFEACFPEMRDFIALCRSYEKTKTSQFKDWVYRLIWDP